MADPPRKENLSPAVMAASMLLGALVGFIIWMITETFVFLPVFIGAGLTIGLAWAGRGNDEDT